ncbi:MAG: hypothetical protein MI861_00465 [Pirellulales bacterium]|nr:hypothetical protein [Pirellulales bacterium]
MKSKLSYLCRLLLSLAVLTCYSTAFVGCSGDTDQTEAGSQDDQDGDDHDDHDHDDDDHDHDADGHEGHDHAEHGPNGGHMVNLSGGSHAEWSHDDQKNLLTVYVEDPETVLKVEMKTVIEGAEETYAFEKVADQEYYQLVSPDLLTAVKMGQGNVKTTLVITTADGEATGQVTHHAH